MNKKALVGVVLFCCVLSSCFKRTHVNENALLQQKACIDSIAIKDFERALTHCELCLEYDSAMPECLNGVGLIALNYADEKKAIDYFSRALRQDNDFSESRNNLGVIYFSHGNFEKALKYFTRALEIDPSNTDARYNAGLSYFRLAERNRAQGNIQQTQAFLMSARDNIKKLIALEPEYDHAFRDLGLIELNRYDITEYSLPSADLLKDAEEAFHQCLLVNPTNNGCYEGMGQVKTEQGRFEEAFAQFYQCLSYDSHNSACRQGIAHAFEKSALAEQGYKKFKDSLRHQAHNAQAHEAFCAALFEKGLKKEAQGECELALTLDPKLCQAHFRLGNYYSALLHGEKAKKHCQEYLWCEKGPGNVEQQRVCQEIVALVK